MIDISTTQLIGLLVSILGIAGLAIYSGTRPQTFANVNRAPIVSGIIMGTLVGGSSTVGTAQLAYNYGLSAWWFTLGGGIACLVLALVYTKPLRASGCMTLVGIIRKEFGPEAGLATSLLNSVGTFINIISQLLAGTAVIAVIAPGLPILPSLIITAGFMALYVICGGTQGAGRVGILKLVLLYISMLGCGAMVLRLTGGLSSFQAMVRNIDNPEGVRFFSLFARGIGKDGGACLSLILGVLTTQTYAQAVMSGRSDSAARTGALISTVLIPPIGAGGILVGLFMRATAPDIAAKTALTSFVTTYMPGIFSGLVLGTLFIAVVGTGAGLAMGISTIIRRDILQRFSDRLAEAKLNTILSRIVIVLVLALGCVLSTGSLGDTILNFAFMSMGLRGAVVFVPMSCALWLHGKVDRRWALIGIIAGPLTVLICGTVAPLPGGIDALFGGIAVSLLCHGIGLIAGKRQAGVKVMKTQHAAAEHCVLAVDSQLCCGNALAEALARTLNIPLYRDEILQGASASSGIPLRVLQAYEHRPVSAAYDLSAEDISALCLPTTGELVAAQQAACRELARRGPCVLQNHFAAAALSDDLNCIRIFIHADGELRAETYAREMQLGPAAGRNALHRADRQWVRLQKIGSSVWGRSDFYDAVIDECADTPEKLAAALLQSLGLTAPAEHAESTLS